MLKNKAPAMTSRERMFAAMELKPTDVVPVYPNILPDHACHVFGMDYRDVLENPLLGYDLTIKAGRAYGFDGLRVWMGPRKDWKEDKNFVREGEDLFVHDKTTGERIAQFDVQGGGSMMPLRDGVFTRDKWGFPIGQKVKTASDLGKIEIVKASDYFRHGQMEPVEKFIKQVGHEMFVAGICCDQSMNFLLKQRGSEQALTDLIDNPGLARKIMAIALEISIEKGKAFIQAGVDALYIGDSYASCSVISPKQYREFCFPNYCKATEEFHRLGVKVYQHCCGNCNPLLELVADEGVDAIECLDPTSGMDVADAKRRVGDRVCLMGGVSCITLFKGNPEDVRMESLECIRKGAFNGGFALGSACEIPPKTPVANVKAMVQAAKESV